MYVRTYVCLCLHVCVHASTWKNLQIPKRSYTPLRSACRVLCYQTISDVKWVLDDIKDSPLLPITCITGSPGQTAFGDLLDNIGQGQVFLIDFMKLSSHGNIFCFLTTVLFGEFTSLLVGQQCGDLMFLCLHLDNTLYIKFELNLDYKLVYSANTNAPNDLA